MVIKRIGAVSCAKITGLLYAIVGLLFGGIMALISLAGGLAAMGGNRMGSPFAFFGVGAVIVFPLLYGAFGFVMTLIAASIYNVLAGVVGGIELDVRPSAGAGWAQIAEPRVPAV